MFGKRLKLLRSEKKMTQQQLADLLKVSPSTVGMYEQGRRDPDTETVKFLADFFNVSLDYLLGRTDIRNPRKHDEITTKAYHNLDVEGLPEEAIRQVEEYIEFIKQKYNPDGTLKKKNK